MTLEMVMQVKSTAVHAVVYSWLSFYSLMENSEKRIAILINDLATRFMSLTNPISD